MTTHVLGYSWADAVTILPALHDRLVAEDDPPARAGLMLAAANLTTQLPVEDRPAAVHRLERNLAHEDPVVRFNTALGWAEARLREDEPVPAVVLTALAEALHDGGQAWVDLWGRGWSHASGAAMDALWGRDLDRFAFVLRLAEQPVRPSDYRALLVETVVTAYTRDGGLPPEPRVAMADRLIEMIGDLLLDAALPVRTRVGVAKGLADLPNGVARPAADQLVEGLGDPDREIRLHAAYALAHAGDHRCLPALREIIGRGPLPWRSGRLLSGMWVHAADLLPAVAQRLATVPEARFDVGGLVGGLASWGRAAAPLEPELRRILTLFEAGEDPATLKPWHTTAVIRSTLAAISA
jgi:hypothetical protein